MFVACHFCLSMNTFTADTFLLPTSCRAAIPFFEESDSLRENAVHWNDLVAAFYLRWKGIKMCIDTLPHLSEVESTYVKSVLEKLLLQVEELKNSYKTNEEEGMVQVLEESDD